METRDRVHDLESRLQKSKDNIEQIQKIMSTWMKTALFDRTEEKGSTLLSLKDRDDRTRRRYEEIEQAGIKIHDLLKVQSSPLHPLISQFNFELIQIKIDCDRCWISVLLLFFSLLLFNIINEDLIDWLID